MFLLGIILAIGLIHQVPAQIACPTCSYDEYCNTTLGICECDPAMDDDSVDVDVSSLLQRTKLICDSQMLILRYSSCLGRVLYNKGFLEPVTSPDSFPCFYFDKPNPDVHGETLFAFNFTSVNPSCAYDFSKNDTFATYSISVPFKYDTVSQPVILYNDVAVNFSCSFPLDMVVSLDMAMNPIVSTTSISVAGGGTYQTKMALYKNADFTVPYTTSDMQTKMKVGDPLYIGAFVTGPDPGKYSFLIDSCFATPINDSNSQQKYSILSGGCPVSSSTVALENGVSLTCKLSTKLIKFSGSDQIYMFCSGNLCSGTCKPSCPARLIARTSYSEDLGGVGPVFVSSSAPTLTWKAWFLFSLLALKMM